MPNKFMLSYYTILNQAIEYPNHFTIFLGKTARVRRGYNSAIELKYSIFLGKSIKEEDKSGFNKTIQDPRDNNLYAIC